MIKVVCDKCKEVIKTHIHIVKEFCLCDACWHQVVVFVTEDLPAYWNSSQKNKPHVPAGCE